MAEPAHKHIVYVTQRDGKTYLVVDRQFDPLPQHFCSHFELPPAKNSDEGLKLMHKAADWLGNLLCMDNPDFRTHIGIDPKRNK